MGKPIWLTYLAMSTSDVHVKSGVNELEWVEVRLWIPALPTTGHGSLV